MKFTYSPDGLEVRLNQAGVASMLTGNCDKVWGMNNE